MQSVRVSSVPKDPPSSNEQEGRCAGAGVGYAGAVKSGGTEWETQGRRPRRAWPSLT